MNLLQPITTPVSELVQSHNRKKLAAFFHFTRATYGPDNLTRLRKRQLFEVSHITPEMIDRLNLINVNNERHKAAHACRHIFAGIDSVEYQRQLRAEWD